MYYLMASQRCLY